MLNTSIETGITAGEEFEKNLIARMEGARDASVELQSMVAESPEAQQERIAKFKEQAFGRIEKAAGLRLSQGTSREAGVSTLQLPKRPLQ